MSEKNWNEANRQKAIVLTRHLAISGTTEPGEKEAGDTCRILLCNQPELSWNLWKTQNRKTLLCVRITVVGNNLAERETEPVGLINLAGNFTKTKESRDFYA